MHYFLSISVAHVFVEMRFILIDEMSRGPQHANVPLLGHPSLRLQDQKRIVSYLMFLIDKLTKRRQAPLEDES